MFERILHTSVPTWPHFPACKHRWLFAGVTISLIALALGGCSAIHATLALYKPTDQFMRLSSDDRVRYEPGAEKLALLVQQALPQSIRTVETAQYGHFLKPVTVYVCASDDSFYSYGAPKYSVGFMLNQRLFLSPRLAKAPPQHIHALLTHELSHLHLDQHLGLAQFARLPVWFKEGLATEVAQGGGAFGVTDVQAERAILGGHTFTPVRHGNLLFAQTANTFGLTPLLFYRQSALFVRYLRERNPAAFKQMLMHVEDQQDFEFSFVQAYDEPLESAWNEFLRAVKTRAPPDHLTKTQAFRS